MITVCAIRQLGRLLVTHVIDDQLGGGHTTSVGILIELLRQLLGEAGITLLDEHLAKLFVPLPDFVQFGLVSAGFLFYFLFLVLGCNHLASASIDGALHATSLLSEALLAATVEIKAT